MAVSLVILPNLLLIRSRSRGLLLCCRETEQPFTSRVFIGRHFGFGKVFIRMHRYLVERSQVAGNDISAVVVNKRRFTKYLWWVKMMEKRRDARVMPVRDGQLMTPGSHFGLTRKAPLCSAIPEPKGCS
ncbi:hypothetical protein GGI35DRAFT_456009 [Trichoderma velutinum]